MSVPLKFWYCQNCDTNMVNSRNDGTNRRFCRDCMLDYLEKMMLKKRFFFFKDPNIKRLKDGEEHIAR